MNQPSPAVRRTWIDRFLNVVEKGGNTLPHPATLFAILALLVILLSWITAQFELAVLHPVTGAEIRPVNLVSIEGLHRILTNLITNFTGFAPLGTVLVSLIGIGVAEHSGLIGAALRKLILSAPRFLLTPIVVFAGVMSNMASEIGYVLLVPLAGLMFKAAGRHPILGMAAGFAGVSGGYSANLLLGTIDPLLAGLSQEAARILDPDYTVNPAANWYFMIASTPLVAVLGTFVTEKIIAPRFPDENPQPAPLREKIKWTLHLLTVVMVPVFVYLTIISSDALVAYYLGIGGEGQVSVRWVIGLAVMLFAIVGLILMNNKLFGSISAGDGAISSSEVDPMSAAEHRGLIYAIIATLALTALVLWGTVPSDGFLRDPVTGDLLNSPFLKGIVALIFAYGVIAGVAYGIGAGTIKSDEDVIRGMGQSMSTLGGYLVLTFFAAQFVAFFTWTQLGLIFAVEGAGVLQAVNMPAIPLFLCFILLTATANLFMGSASAKWALMAPVFVPMFMILGFSPEMTQLSYRIGDSVTNIISPMMSYFALIIAFLQRYEPKAGIGTVVAVMLPYSIVFAIGWSLLFVIWLTFGFPIGPGAPLNYIPAVPAG